MLENHPQSSKDTTVGKGCATGTGINNGWLELWFRWLGRKLWQDLSAFTQAQFLKSYNSCNVTNTTDHFKFPLPGLLGAWRRTDPLVVDNITGGHCWCWAPLVQGIDPCVLGDDGKVALDNWNLCALSRNFFAHNWWINVLSYEIKTVKENDFVVVQQMVLDFVWKPPWTVALATWYTWSSADNVLFNLSKKRRMHSTFIWQAIDRTSSTKESRSQWLNIFSYWITLWMIYKWW